MFLLDGGWVNIGREDEKSGIFSIARTFFVCLEGIWYALLQNAKGGDEMPANIFYFKNSDIPGTVSGISDAVFSGLRAGLTDGRIVTVSYTSADYEESRRNILPEAVFRWNEDWYVSAWCYLRAGKRTFRTDRIQEVVVTDRKGKSHGIAEELMKNGVPWEVRPPEKTAPVPEKKYVEIRPDPLAESNLFLKPDGSVKAKDIAKWSFSGNTLSVTMANSCLPRIVRLLLGEKNDWNGKYDCRARLLFVACALLDADCLRKCLKAGADPNFRYRRIYTPVRIVANGYAEFTSGIFLKAIRILHDNGANIASDPLVRNIAAITENTRLKAFLKKAGVKARKYTRSVGGKTSPSGLWARIQVRTGNKGCEIAVSSSNRGSSPPDPDRFSRELVRDSGNGNLEAVMEDLAGGADVNFCGGDGRCALHSAARNGFFEVCKYLIEHGADVTARDGCGDTVLITAARGGNLELIRYLVEEKGCNIHAHDRFGWTPLYCSVMDHHPDLMRYFIEKGANVHSLARDRESLLMLAVGFCFASPEQKVETARYLIGKSVDLNLRDGKGETALVRAIVRDHLEAVDLLLEHGANVNLDNKKGKTPLHAAVSGKCYRIVRTLLAHRADPNIGDIYGITPLMYPTLPLEMLEFFVRSGANVNAVTNNGKTVVMCHAAPFDAARECDLCTYDLRISIPEVIAKLAFLAECGADLGAHDVNGNSAAMLAVGSCEVAAHLLERSGLPINEANRAGETLLIRAVQAKSFKLVRYLVHHGAKRSIKDAKGQTAVDYAWDMYNGSGDEEDVFDIIDFLEP